MSGTPTQRKLSLFMSRSLDRFVAQGWPGRQTLQISLVCTTVYTDGPVTSTSTR